MSTAPFWITDDYPSIFHWLGMRGLTAFLKMVSLATLGPLAATKSSTAKQSKQLQHLRDHRKTGQPASSNTSKNAWIQSMRCPFRVLVPLRVRTAFHLISTEFCPWPFAIPFPIPSTSFWVKSRSDFKSLPQKKKTSTHDSFNENQLNAMRSWTKC